MHLTIVLTPKELQKEVTETVLLCIFHCLHWMIC